MRKSLAVLLPVLVLYSASTGCGPKEGTLEYWIDDLDARKPSDRLKAVKEIARMAEEVRSAVDMVFIETLDEAVDRVLLSREEQEAGPAAANS